MSSGIHTACDALAGAATGDANPGPPEELRAAQQLQALPADATVAEVLLDSAEAPPAGAKASAAEITPLQSKKCAAEPIGSASTTSNI